MTALSADPPRIQIPVLAVAMLALAALVFMAASHGGTRLALATLIGGFAGLALYHATFGFTAAWRRFTAEKRGAGLRAQFLLIALTITLSYPLIAHGELIGIPANGWVFPFGVSAAIGAFVFGIGMQLGGGCASGTLFTVGGGSTRMVVTLIAFITGSVIATAHLPFWGTLPRIPGTSVIGEFGAFGAVLLTLMVFAALWLVTVMVEKRSHGDIKPQPETGSILTGPWSYVLGAIAIAGVSIATLIILGRPWGITSAFALWGAKIGTAAGYSFESWPYWANQTALIERSVFTDATSVMNFGIIAGAMAAAALAGRFSPTRTLTITQLMTAIVGGLMMGYGARLAYGCNIGAYLGGIVSGSLHGWGWLVFGYLGSIVGTALRARLD